MLKLVRKEHVHQEPFWEHQTSRGKEPECLLAHKTRQLLAWTASVQQYMPYELRTMAVSKLSSRCALKCVYSPGPPFFPGEGGFTVPFDNSLAAGIGSFPLGTSLY